MNNWKPGDVALVLNEHGVWNVAICAVRARHGTVWSYGVADSWMPLTADARPLVVLDPDDREQVERIMRSFVRAVNTEGNFLSSSDANRVDAMQAALRSLVVPPRPTEPTGLGAVVEDEQGRKWVRSLNPGADLTRDDWRAGDAQFGDGGAREWFFWDDIKAVRVLSDGVA